MKTFVEKIGDLGLQEHIDLLMAYVQGVETSAQLDTVDALCQKYPALESLLETARDAMFQVLFEKKF